ncbi:MAG: flavodoxin family protein [Betaproteobacteria bacterium]|jgi:multimeric flavodoxin WrbA|nr:flavodoxin family protein [Betaproteobacteria bacterium]NDG04014.1 flavodoxin family protein [Alphaproteobacteria bacterium]NBO94270.1 flavodoxin family protein [Betaproteobacteria bacterium]NBP33883.1 flavodoxin family protein [Betaproteobacteria bacterium]NBP36818.1 flavodoxin family protein [Betaproteobacteria bacterium]
MIDDGSKHASFPRTAPLPSLLILFHSRTGGSLAMAEAFLEGAQSEAGIEVRIMPFSHCQADDLLAASAYAFIGPENLGGLSGAMKECFDRHYYPLLGRVQGRRYQHLVCAGSDGQGAAKQLARIVQGWRLVAIQEAFIVCTQAQSEEAILAPKQLAPASLAACREIGLQVAAGLAIGAY